MFPSTATVGSVVSQHPQFDIQSQDHTVAVLVFPRFRVPLLRFPGLFSFIGAGGISLIDCPQRIVHKRLAHFIVGKPDWLRFLSHPCFLQEVGCRWWLPRQSGQGGNASIRRSMLSTRRRARWLARAEVVSLVVALRHRPLNRIRVLAGRDRIKRRQRPLLQRHDPDRRTPHSHRWRRLPYRRV